MDDNAARAPLGVIGGSAFLDAVALEGARARDIVTAHGTVTLHDAGDVVLLRRHGEAQYRPPHRIPHHANVAALESLGVRHVAAFASVGSMRESLRPGDIVIPDDYMSTQPPPTFAGDEYLHIVPTLDVGVRTLLLQCAREVADTAVGAHTVADRGVYVETRGPRFETKAEIRALAAHADVVGMTAASEATLFQERGLGYAVLCIVDNWAHGIGSAPLTLEAFQAQLARNGGLARALLHELVRRWRSPPSHAGDAE